MTKIYELTYVDKLLGRRRLSLKTKYSPTKKSASLAPPPLSKKDDDEPKVNLDRATVRMAMQRERSSTQIELLMATDSRPLMQPEKVSVVGSSSTSSSAAPAWYGDFQPGNDAGCTYQTFTSDALLKAATLIQTSWACSEIVSLPFQHMDIGSGQNRIPLLFECVLKHATAFVGVESDGLRSSLASQTAKKLNSASARRNSPPSKAFTLPVKADTPANWQGVRLFSWWANGMTEQSIVDILDNIWYSFENDKECKILFCCNKVLKVLQEHPRSKTWHFTWFEVNHIFMHYKGSKRGDRMYIIHLQARVLPLQPREEKYKIGDVIERAQQDLDAWHEGVIQQFNRFEEVSSATRHLRHHI
jgi:hypothetical protein